MKLNLSSTQVKEIRNVTMEAQKSTIEKIFGKEITSKCLPRQNKFIRKDGREVEIFSTSLTNSSAILSPSIAYEGKLFISDSFNVSIETESNGKSYLKIQIKDF